MIKLANYEFFLERRKLTLAQYLDKNCVNLDLKEARSFMTQKRLTLPEESILELAICEVLENRRLAEEKKALAEAEAKKPKKTVPRRQQKKKAQEADKKQNPEKSKNDKYFRRVVSPKKKSK